MLSFYGDKIYSEEKEELIKNSLELISKVHFLKLDNSYLIDILAHIIFQLNHTKLMSYSLLGNLTDLYDDDLKSLFLVFKKVIELDNDAKDIFSQFKYVNDNRETFDNIIEG